MTIIPQLKESCHAWRCKHIYEKFHFLKDLAKDATIEMSNRNTEEQFTNVLTKPLKFEPFDVVSYYNLFIEYFHIRRVYVSKLLNGYITNSELVI